MAALVQKQGHGHCMLSQHSLWYHKGGTRPLYLPQSLGESPNSHCERSGNHFPLCFAESRLREPRQRQAGSKKKSEKGDKEEKSGGIAGNKGEECVRKGTAARTTGERSTYCGAQLAHKNKDPQQLWRPLGRTAPPNFKLALKFILLLVLPA